MNSFFYRFRSAVARFMYGRNGADRLCWALMALYVFLSIAGGFVRVPAVCAGIQTLAAASAVLALFRMLSRDLPRRRAENAWFLRRWTPLRTGFRDARYRRADKAHKYVKCSCGVWCRVPRSVGKIELKCPKCGEKKIVRT